MSYSGFARLFPVPNLVMFPHVIQPLHIFEPRYQALLAAALADDQLIAMPVLAPGWESGYEHPPQLEPVACLTKIVSHNQRQDGRSNLLVVGLHRIKLLDELPAQRAYREASVNLLAERSSDLDAGEQQRVRRRLLDAFKGRLCRQVHETASLDELLDREVSLGVLTDLIAHTLDFEFSVKVRLLAECDVDRRAVILLEAMSMTTVGPAIAAAGRCQFPPDFSVN